MNIIFEKREVPSNYVKNKPLHKKGDKSEWVIYGSISIVSTGSKLLSMMIVLRLRKAIDKV
jgi:hypothetical protein